MKGFVIALRKAKNEDVISTVLSSSCVRSYYRFFGARHSILQFGHLIDFEVEGEQDSFMPRLRGLSHIGFDWLYDNNRLLAWHNYIKLFEPHLKDTQEIDTFYYDLLLASAQKWGKQNPKRIVCENYIHILEHEGRLHSIERCYICDMPIGDESALMHAYIPVHPHCIQSNAIDKKRLIYLFENAKTLYLSDDEVEYLYSVAMKGL